MKRRCRETGACLDREKLGFILQLETIYLVYGSVSFPSYTNAFISVFSSTSA